MVKVRYNFIAGKDLYLGNVVPGGIYETTEQIAKQLIASKRYDYVEEEKEETVMIDRKVKNKNSNK